MSKPQTEKEKNEEKEPKSEKELNEEQLDKVSGGSDPQIEVTP